MFHIVNGDLVKEKMDQIGGEIIVWREMYDYGPLNLCWSQTELIHQRARFFEKKIAVPASLFIENCTKQNNTLVQLPNSSPINLWFEHDRYDQAMLMFLINELSRNGYHNLYLISPIAKNDEDLYALSHYTPRHLVDLFKLNRIKLTEDHIHEAIKGWKSYTSSNPSAIKTWIDSESHHLPYLLPAMESHLDYFPQDSHGLNKVEYLLMKKLETSNISFRELFRYISSIRVYDGLSDLHVAAIIGELTMGKSPLLKSSGPLPNFANSSHNPLLSLTPIGTDVSAGRKNRIKVNGIDWWVGGVHFYVDV